MQLWSRSADARLKRPKHRPKRRHRPGMTVEPQAAEDDKPMTVAEYARRSGLAIELEGR